MSQTRKILSALQHLKANNYSAYIATLARLGIDVAAELGIRSIKELANITDKVPHFSLQSPDAELRKLKHWSTSDWEMVRLRAAYFCCHWTQSELARNGMINLPHPKQNLNRSSRHYIHLGMWVLDAYLSQHSGLVITAAELNKLEPWQANINEAIRCYRSTRQKITDAVAKTLAVMTSLAVGVLETGVAIFFVGMMLFSPTGWLALAGLLTTSLVSGVILSYISYCTLKTDVPGVLHEVTGKDRFLQGFLEYKNEDGRTIALSTKDRLKLGLFSLLFALPSAVTSGAFGFTACLSIPAIVSLFGLSVTTALFPPIGAIFALTITLTMTLFSMRSFYSFITKYHSDPLLFIRQPFDQISEMINENKNPLKQPIANQCAKKAAFAVTGLCCALSICGLGVSSMGGINSVNALAMKLFHASPKIGMVFGIIVGGVISYGAKLFFTIAKTGGAVVNLFKLAYHKTSAQLNKFGLITGIVLDLPLSAGFWWDSFFRPPASTPLIPMPSTATTAAIAITTTTFKDAGLIIHSMFEPDTNKENENIKANVIDNIDQFTKQQKFIKSPSALQSHSIFKQSDLIAEKVHTEQTNTIFNLPHFYKMTQNFVLH